MIVRYAQYGPMLAAISREASSLAEVMPSSMLRVRVLRSQRVWGTESNDGNLKSSIGRLTR